MTAETIAVSIRESVGVRSSVEITESIEEAIAKSPRGVKPHFLKLGNAYGLGQWLKEWPPRINDVAYFILLGNGRRPLHLTDLAEGVNRIRPLSEPHIAAVRLAISRDKRFTSLGSGLYGLHGWRKQLANPSDFHYSTPAQNWTVSKELVDILQETDDSLKVACPYIDRSTFEMFLNCVPKSVKVQLLIGDDPRLSTKVSEGLSSVFFSAWMKSRKLEIRRIGDLHSRFLVMDDVISIVSSADLQKYQQQQKYQFLLVTSDSVVAINSLEYFNLMWESAASVDLLAEIAATEKGAKVSAAP